MTSRGLPPACKTKRLKPLIDFAFEGKGWEVARSGGHLKFTQARPASDFTPARRRRSPRRPQRARSTAPHRPRGHQPEATDKGGRRRWLN